MMTSATRKTRTVGTRQVALRIAVGAVALLTAATAGASSDANVKTPLTPTASAARARGKVKLKLKTGKPGRFVLSAGRLTPGHTFDVVVRGV